MYRKRLAHKAELSTLALGVFILLQASSGHLVRIKRAAAARFGDEWGATRSGDDRRRSSVTSGGLIGPPYRMEVVTAALPSVLSKLGELLVGEYNLQKGVKMGIRFLEDELKSMQGALVKISGTPVDQLDIQDKIWAKDVRELSYDIEDKIDTFMVQVKGSEPVRQHGFKKFLEKTIRSLKQPKSHRQIATDIIDIKRRVEEVAKRRDRYRFDNNAVAKPVKVDPRALVRYEKVTELVGIDEARDEVIKILTEGNEVSKQQGKIVSIVGFGGLGKTTLANLVYEKLKAQFDCTAFVSVSQTPDMDKLLKNMFYQLANYSTEGIDVIEQLRKFLHKKRYFVIVDDIWKISDWKTIRCALPEDSHGCKIITTTRIFTVAKQIGDAYKMKPLSHQNSRILMYGRIFGKEDKHRCPDEQLEEVSEKILKKCAGVPLAIITIASLLVSKGRNKLEWYEVCKSIGTGLEDNDNVDSMRKVLSISYYDMPSHLRTCLLHLSVFPEDKIIDKHRLIWLWIAEGFIQSEKQQKSLFEMTESYLNELVNRSMVQPIYDDEDKSMIVACRVHDMVLDLICSLSSEDNFATISNSVHCTSPPEKIRRLSLQNGKMDHNIFKVSTSMEQVRSVVAFGPSVDLMPTLENFIVLRVLDLKDCDLSQCYTLKHLGNLLHLRYLGLGGTKIRQLPEEVGNLQFLQTLDVENGGLRNLPMTIVQLKYLMCLRIHPNTTPPNGIGSLTSLEELSEVKVYNNSCILEELSHLTELKVLTIYWIISWEERLNKSLMEWINKLEKIHSLRIQFDYRVHQCIPLDGWVYDPRHLRRLELVAVSIFGSPFSGMPAWVNPSQVPCLSFLKISVRELRQEGLEILGRLPALRCLKLYLEIPERFVVGAGLFPCLVRCHLGAYVGHVVLFQQGAMPRLTTLELFSHTPKTIEINGGFDLGLGNLLSLQDVEVVFGRGDASMEEVEEAKAAVRHAIEIHPNHPTLEVRIADEDEVGCIIDRRRDFKLKFIAPFAEINMLACGQYLKLTLRLDEFCNLPRG
ncbi:hypothetical protein ACP70R_008157 [Stipagrostis hirtigluma subsp. patula]